MKILITVVVLIISAQFCQGQGQEVPSSYITTIQLINGFGETHQIVNNEGYKALKLYDRTYTVKGMKQFDNELVSQIDIGSYEHLYHETERVVVYDSNINREIILFSRDEITVDREIWKKRGSLLIGVAGFNEKLEKVY